VKANSGQKRSLHMKIHLTIFLACATAFSTTALSANDQRPKPISQVLPEYSFDLRRSRIEGDVLLSFTITSQGGVADATVVRSTRREFELPALVAIKQWKFIPATRDGLAVSTPTRQLVAFAMLRSQDVEVTPVASATLAVKFSGSAETATSDHH
jgi:TonB family protein